MGIASLVLGIVSIIIGFVPLCGAIAFLPAVIGLILGIIDMVKKSKSNEKKGQAIAGIVMCAIAILVIFFWVFIAAAGGATSSNNTISSTKESTSSIISNNSQTTSNSTSLKSKYSVGENYKGNNLSITYISVDDDFRGYSRYATIKDGYKVIKAEFEFENLGSSDQYVSSFEFNCFADGYDCEKFYSVDDSSFGATLSKGKKAKGAVYYEVPEDANSIIVEYTLNAWTSSKVEFIIK